MIILSAFISIKGFFATTAKAWRAPAVLVSTIGGNVRLATVPKSNGIDQAFSNPTDVTLIRYFPAGRWSNLKWPPLSEAVCLTFVESPACSKATVADSTAWPLASPIFPVTRAPVCAIAGIIPKKRGNAVRKR